MLSISVYQFTAPPTGVSMPVSPQPPQSPIGLLIFYWWFLGILDILGRSSDKKCVYFSWFFFFFFFFFLLKGLLLLLLLILLHCRILFFSFPGAQSLSHVWFFGAMDWSLPGPSVQKIFRSITLAWAAIPYFRVSSRPRDGTSISCFGSWILYH